MMRFLPLALVCCTVGAWSQANHGELRFAIADPSGAALRARVDVESLSNQFHASLDTDATGHLTIAEVPFGVYDVTVEKSGFAEYHTRLDVRSTVPLEKHMRLALASVESNVKVSDQDTLIDLNSVSTADRVGRQQIENRLSSLPGRSVEDLVVSQPGWLYEGNAVLHPRGSEYQTQFVVDGIPLTDNRSPGFGPEIESDDLESIGIYTAGFPAEYGRKMGGVVELNTRRQTNPGLHGNLVMSGGSYDTLSGYGQLQETRKNEAYALSASGAHTDHYLNPVVPANYTNTGTSADFTGMYERDLDSNDRLMFNVRHELSRYLIPNELIQQQAGQVQNGDDFETIGTARFQHILSPDSLIFLSGMVREDSQDLASNKNPTPIAAFLNNHFTEGYFKGTWSLHHGHHELKAGVESDSTFLHEAFHYSITDPAQFDPGTPLNLAFADQRPDLEQSGFIEDLFGMRNWSASIGLRWDHYQLLLNRHAFSPRVTVGRAFPGHDLAVHASYDRIFQTPSFENILISGSTQITALSSDFLRLPVQPSTGNDFEIGATKAFANRVRLDLTNYWRRAHNYADDDQLLNTGVSYPIAFDRGVTYGSEAKLQLVGLGPVSGFASYSYMVAQVWFPVTGGLFLGKDADDVLSSPSGHFPASQDQRNTLATRWETKVTSRLSIAAGALYGSGLPFDYDGTAAEALAQYGPEIVSRLNFARGRILPLLSVNASIHADLVRSEHLNMALHVDGENLNDRLNVLDFGGLFSGNAIAPARAVLLRWDVRF